MTRLSGAEGCAAFGPEAAPSPHTPIHWIARFVLIHAIQYLGGLMAQNAQNNSGQKPAQPSTPRTPNGPSTTGNKSGDDRGNNPPKK